MKNPCTEMLKTSAFYCGHCGFKYAVVPSTMKCKWCHEHFLTKPAPLPPMKEVTC